MKADDSEVIRRLALAFKATSSVFRDCAPDLPVVCERLAEYLEEPGKAEAQLLREEEQLARLHRLR